MCFEAGCATAHVARQIQLASAQQRVARGRFLQLQHGMLAFDQKVPELLAVFLLVQFPDVVEFHRCRQPVLHRSHGYRDRFGDSDSIHTCREDAAGIARAFTGGIQTAHD